MVVLVAASYGVLLLANPGRTVLLGSVASGVAVAGLAVLIYRACFRILPRGGAHS